MKMRVVNTLVLGALAFSILSTGYRITYFDCQKPKDLNQYNFLEYCSINEDMEVEQKTLYILQRRKNVQTSGHSCEVIRSTFTIHCGMFSHNEVIKMPDIEVKKPLSLLECQTLLTTGFWTTSEGTRHQIEMGQEEIIHVSEKGVLHQDSNKIWCEGEDLKINGNIIPGVIQMVQYRVLVQEEQFIVEKNRLEVLASHTKLPDDCELETGGCIADKTYVWKTPEDSCPLERINVGRFNQDLGGWLVDHDNKILFKPTKQSQAPFGCPSTELIATEYADLFLTEHHGFPRMRKQVNLETYVHQTADYLLYQTERLVLATRTSTTTTLCQEKFTQGGDGLIPMGRDGRFGRRSGDVLYIFKCHKKTGKVQASNQCYDRIPLEGSNEFIDPYTKVATKHGVVKECNRAFPEALLTLEGWVALPSLRPIPEPTKYTLSDTGIEHEDMARGGLYTREEMDEWSHFISYGDFKESTLSRISTGACTHQEFCKATSTLPMYNLDRLIDENITNPFGFMQVVHEWITTYGGYAAMIVLIVWIAKGILWLALVFNTVIREGKHVAVALLYAICCGSLYKTGRIRNRTARRAKVPTAPAADYEMQLPV